MQGLCRSCQLQKETYWWDRSFNSDFVQLFFLSRRGLKPFPTCSLIFKDKIYNLQLIFSTFSEAFTHLFPPPHTHIPRHSSAVHSGSSTAPQHLQYLAFWFILHSSAIYSGVKCKRKRTSHGTWCCNCSSAHSDEIWEKFMVWGFRLWEAFASHTPVGTEGW